MAIRSYKHSNIEYVALKEEASQGVVAGTPDTYIKVQSHDLEVDPQKADDTRIAGHKGMRSDMHNGLLSIEGTMNVYADPNLLYHELNAEFAAGTTVDNADTTFTTDFDCLSETDPKSYTHDKSINGRVFRYSGVQTTELPFSYDEGENVGHSETGKVAQNYFWNARIASVTGGEPSTIVFKQDQHQAPTELLFVGDTLTGYDMSSNTEVSLTIASIVDGTSITTTEDAVSLVEDDQIFIASKAISGITWFAENAPFTWDQLEVKKGLTLGTIATVCALPDTTVNLKHEYEYGRCAGNRAGVVKRKSVDAEITFKNYVGLNTDVAQYFDNVPQVYQFIWTKGLASLTITVYGKVQTGKPETASNELEVQSFTVMPIIDSSTNDFFTISLTNTLDTV